MLKVNVLQIGLRRRFVEAAAFQEIGALNCLFTDLWSNKGTSLIKSKRFNNKIDDENVYSVSYIGYIYPLLRRLFKSKKSLDKLHYFISWLMVKSIGEQLFNCEFIYAFSGEAIHFKEQIKSKNIKLILDQKGMPRAYYKKKYINEVVKDNRQKDNSLFWDKIESIEFEEWELATVVVCGSQAVADELIKLGCKKNKIKLVNSFYTPTKFELKKKTLASDTEKLKILYVGNIHPLKGVEYMFNAAKKLTEVATFTLVGSVDSRFDYLIENLPENVSWKGALPHEKLAHEYINHDLFLFPSLSEGAAMVTYEAMSYGLPVICTHSAGSVVEDNVSGEIIYDLTVDTIVQKIKNLSVNNQLLNLYSSNSLAIGERYNQKSHKEQIAELIK